MEIRVVRGGALSTVQDLGRAYYRHAGVPLGGAMDAFALRLGNLLVGNEERAAGIEVTLGGVELRFPQGGVVAVTGASYEGITSWRPMTVGAGQSVTLGTCVRGCRGYIAVRGGIAVPLVLGSRSTYSRGGWGGLEGRRLQEGDLLSVGEAEPATVPPVAASWSLLPGYASAATLRIIAGAQAAWFGEQVTAQEYKVSVQSDRMGLRLHAAEALKPEGKVAELASGGVVPGTIQVPPDGLPIVLGVDAQTIGGYPQAGQVVSVDLPVLAQLRPGDTVKFKVVTLAEAQWLALQREQDIALLRAGLRVRWEQAAG